MRISGAQIDLGRFQGFVGQINLYVSKRYAGFVPTGRTSLAKAMEVELLADGICLAGYVGFVLSLVAPFGNCRLALPAI